mmetsp:Transcript_7469/g.16201  ORF Transcript_7469/g.16201 Transcript_7469/m.16201 type:complete len:152 (+) Transcript_7469:35-490(+)
MNSSSSSTSGMVDDEPSTVSPQSLRNDGEASAGADDPTLLDLCARADWPGVLCQVSLPVSPSPRAPKRKRGRIPRHLPAVPSPLALAVRHRAPLAVVRRVYALDPSASLRSDPAASLMNPLSEAISVVRDGEVSVASFLALADGRDHAGEG